MMSTREKKIYMEKQKGNQKKMLALLATALFITIGSVIFGSTFSDAHGNTEEEPVLYKYYKSIEIQPGDTLWDIANEYMTDEYEDTREYIEELKELNSLSSDNIQESQRLMVVYYDKKFK